MSLRSALENLVQQWACQHLPAQPQGEWIQPCQDPRFGHFQSNIAMVAGKTLKQNPRELAQQLATFCSQDATLEKVEVAGPGFVNFTLKPEAILSALHQLAQDAKLGIQPTTEPRTIVIDFSSPNVAKAMHVGHIRSTILGDCLSKALKTVGHTVINDNHIGDWGTQFGKIILGYKQNPHIDADNAIEQMEALYKAINQACEKDEALLNQAREELVKLQNGDTENLRLWELFRQLSQKEFDAIYERLGINFDITLGESFYNPWLKDVVQDLRQRGVAKESDGATVVYFEQEDLKEHPFLIEKSDGAALYSTTDLATVQYRAHQLKAHTMIYVTDGRQQLHFKQLFATARMWKYQDIRFEHVWFGSILGTDKKPLKTREGNPIKLKDLLDEAEARALAILKEKRPDLSDDKAPHLARVLGIGALKYADLAQNRNLDYVFDWDKLLAFDGNTAPYLINAYVRTRSILRKHTQQLDLPTTLEHEHALDLDLAQKIMDYADTVQLVAQELRPHFMCVYLYELASLFHRFFEHCPVLQAPTENLKHTRLQLCRLTGDVLRHGLNLLGIQVVEEM